MPYILETHSSRRPGTRVDVVPGHRIGIAILLPSVGDVIELSDQLRLIVVKRLFSFRSERHQCVELVCQSTEQHP